MKCRALLDTGVSGSYVLAFLVNLLKVKPSRKMIRGIKTIMGIGDQARRDLRCEDIRFSREVRAASLRDENRTM